ncbi:DUF7475 family protein [Halorientalis salina]|uniref:DUF7475 family protein n=1 Tax=Halorientalis salina TaxID=2932266 RepID=UPI0010AC668E|nr:hypothetical protein [Halorientalis salina]
MAAQSTAEQRDRTFLRRPPSSLAYVAVIAALVTGVLHVLLAPRAMGMNQTMGVLFFLNGLGFIGGVLVYVTRYWRREFYLVAALYSVVTILALFVFQGVGVEAFYTQGSINPMAVLTKAVELVLAVVAVVLYRTAES